MLTITVSAIIPDKSYRNGTIERMSAEKLRLIVQDFEAQGYTPVIESGGNCITIKGPVVTWEYTVIGGNAHDAPAFGRQATVSQ